MPIVKRGKVMSYRASAQQGKKKGLIEGFSLGTHLAVASKMARGRIRTDQFAVSHSLAFIAGVFSNSLNRINTSSSQGLSLCFLASSAPRLQLQPADATARLCSISALASRASSPPPPPLLPSRPSMSSSLSLSCYFGPPVTG